MIEANVHYLEPEVDSLARNLLKYIYKKCFKPKEHKDRYDVASYYLGINRGNILRLANSKLRLLSDIGLQTEKNKIFIEQDILKSTETVRTHLRTKLQLGTPTTTKYILNILRQTKYPILWDKPAARKLLYDMGYIWKFSPKLQCNIIIEDPERTFVRYRYLKKVAEFKAQKRNVIYIDCICVNDNNTVHHISELNQPDIDMPKLRAFYYAMSETKICACTMMKISRAAFAEWVKLQLLREIPASSVVVIVDHHYNNEQFFVPNEDTLKRDVKKWLDENNIPYPEEARKCELLKLVPQTTTFKIDEVLKASGHIVLRIPEFVRYCLPTDYTLDYFKKYFGGKRVGKYMDFELLAIIDQGPFTKQSLIKFTKEHSTLQEDINHDQKYDKLFDASPNDVFEVLDSESDFSVHDFD